MPTFPRRSTGVLLSISGEQAIAYDLVTETAHQMNVSAAMVLDACDGSSEIGGAVRDWAAEYGVDPDVLASDVNTGLDSLADLSLVGRDEAFKSPQKPRGSTAAGDPGDTFGAVHRVIDHDIAFRGPQPELLATIDAHLGTGRTDREPTMVFDVHEEPTGEVVLVTDYEWSFPSLQACLNQLTTVVNEYAVWTHSCAALHAGAVRSPAGEVVLLPAPSGAGKSTLTAAFVAAGWDYVGDEAIGVRPGSCTAVGYPKRIAIDNDSRAVLGLPTGDDADIDPAELRRGVARLDGDVGPVTRVLLPTWTDGAPPSLQRLAPNEAVVELLANTLNLARAGQAGLDAVADLAATVSVERLTYGHAPEVVTYAEALQA